MFSKCRACFGLTDNMKFLTESEPEGKQLIAMYTAIVSCEWINNLRLPAYLCSDCESALEISYKFQKKCRETHEILISLLDQHGPVKVEIEENVPKIVDDYDSLEENPQEKIIKKSKRRIKKVPDEEVSEALNEYRNTQNGGLKCIICDHVLSTLRALSTHMTSSHRDIRDNWCYICNKIYSNMPEHRQFHKKSVEICKFCNKRVKRRYFVDHLRMHLRKRPFKCRICDRGFLTKSSLTLHYKHHKEHEVIVDKDKNPLEELPCNDENAIETDVKIEDKTLSVKQLNYCATCNRTVRNLPNHISKVHCKTRRVIEAKSFSCQFCGKEFRANSTLQLHLRLHRGKTPFKCTYCGKPHKSRAHMRDHERVHTGEKPFICNVCGKGFAQSGSLSTHMRQHTGRPEVCKICQKRFCRPSELKLHLRKHSGVKPFLCTECGKTFVQKSHLTEHMTSHSDQRPYQCNFCEKAFKQKSLLASHLQIHSGYKRFKCNVCSYACFKGYRLQQHMKLHDEGCKYSEKIHICPICQKGFTNQTLLNTHKSASHNAIL